MFSLPRIKLVRPLEGSVMKLTHQNLWKRKECTDLDSLDLISRKFSEWIIWSVHSLFSRALRIRQPTVFFPCLTPILRKVDLSAKEWLEMKNTLIISSWITSIYSKSQSRLLVHLLSRCVPDYVCLSFKRRTVGLNKVEVRPNHKVDTRPLMGKCSGHQFESGWSSWLHSFLEERTLP